MTAEFKGKIALDIRDSQPDWGPYAAPTAPENAPNVLYVVWDDVGIATWDCFGGLVDMPAMTRFTIDTLYPVIDPISTKFSELIEVQLDVAKAEYESSRDEYESSRTSKIGFYRINSLRYTNSSHFC
jgi:hypothetical protein